MLKKYSKFMDGVEWTVRKIIGLLMIAMVAIMFYQVVLRYVFNKSNIWSEEVTRYMCVYVALLGSFVAARKNSHLKVDFFVGLLKGKVYKWFTILTTTGIMVFLVYLIPLSYKLSMDTMRSRSPGLKLSMGYVYMAIPVGCVLMLLGMLEVLLKKVTNTEELEEKEDENK